MLATIERRIVIPSLLIKTNKKKLQIKIIAATIKISLAYLFFPILCLNC